MAGGSPSPGGPSLGTATIRVIANTTEFDYRLRRSLRGVTATALTAGAALAGINFLGSSLKEAAKLETVMARIKTIMSTADAQFLNTDTIRAVSDEFGIAAEKIAEAAYTALSSGVSAKNALNVVSTSAKTALETGTDLGVMIKAVTSALAAFGGEGLTASKANDVLFRSLQFGLGTMQQFASQIASAIPAVKAVGGSFEDLAALGAASTKFGKSAQVVFTGLKVAINELADDTKGGGEVFKKLFNEDFTHYVKRTGDLSAALLKFGDKVGADNLVKVLHAKGSAGALQQLLSLPRDVLNDIIKQTRKAQGITAEEFKKVQGTVAFQTQKLKTMWANTKSAFGEALLPTATKVAEQGQRFLKASRPVFQKVSKALGEFLSDPQTGGFFNGLIADLKNLGQTVYRIVGPSFAQFFKALKEFDWTALMNIVKALGTGFGTVLGAALLGTLNLLTGVLRVLSPVVSVLGDMKGIVILLGAALAANLVFLRATAIATALVGANSARAAGGVALLNGALAGVLPGGRGTRRAGGPAAGLTGIPLLLARIPGPAKIAALALLAVGAAAGTMGAQANNGLSKTQEAMVGTKGTLATLGVMGARTMQGLTTVIGVGSNQISRYFGGLASSATTSMQNASAQLRGFASAAEETAYRTAKAINVFVAQSSSALAAQRSIIEKIEHPETYAQTGGYVALQGPGAGPKGTPAGAGTIAKNIADEASRVTSEAFNLKKQMDEYNKTWKDSMAKLDNTVNGGGGGLGGLDDEKSKKAAASEREKAQKSALKSAQALFKKIVKNPAKLTFDGVTQLFNDMAINLKNAGKKNLIKALDPYRTELLKTAKSHDKIIEKLKTAKDNLKSLKDEAKEYGASIKASVIELGNITSNNSYHELLGPDTGKMILNLNNAVASAKQFKTVFKQLQAAGLNKTSLQQLMDAGVLDGLAAGQAILNGGASVVSQLNQGNKDLAEAGGGLGEAAVSAFKQHGIDMAKGLVDELTAKDKTLTIAMETLGQKMAKAFKNELGSVGLILDPVKQKSPTAAKLASKTQGPQSVVGKQDKNGDTQVSVFIDGQEFKGMIHTEIKSSDRTKKAVAKAGSKTGIAGAR